MTRALPAASPPAARARRRSWLWTLLVLVASAAFCTLTLLLHLQHRQARDQLAESVERTRVARIELAEGFLHVVLGAGETAPFDRDGGYALLAQSVRTFDRTAAELQPGAPDLVARFRDGTERFQEQLVAWSQQGPDQAAATRLRLAYDDVENLADELDRANRVYFGGRIDRLEQRFLATFGGAAVLLVGLCALVVLTARAREHADAQAWTHAERWRESVLRQQMAVEASGVGLWDWDLRTNAVSYSPEWKRQIGYAPAEIADDLSEWQSRLHPDDAARCVAMVGAFLQSPDGALEQEFRLRHKDGSWRWILARGAALLDGQGRPVRVIGTHLDVTDAKRAESELRALTDFNQRVLDSLLALICVIDEDGTIVTVNAAWREFARLNRDESIAGIGANYFSLSMAVGDPATAAEVTRGVRAVINGEVREFVCEGRHHGATGDRWFELRVTPFGGIGPARAVLAHVDITQNKQAEEALRRSEASLAAAQEIARMGNWQLDGQASTGFWSTEMYRLFRWAGADPPTPEGFLELVHPDDRQAIRDIHDHPGPGPERAFALEFRSNPDLGELRCFHCEGRLVSGPAGELVSMSGTVWDVTEQHQARERERALQAQLNQAQRLESVGRLAGGVAHDFNNMLAIISGYSELMLEQCERGDPRCGHAEEILSAARRSAELTRQLLAFARQQPASPRAIDLNDGVSSMLKLLRRLIGEGIELVWMPGRDLWTVRIDPSQFDQVLANLTVNARDAIDDVGKVLIETQNVTVDATYAAGRPDAHPGEYVVLTVTDNGCGMSRQMLENVFEPFFTTKDPSQGSGLGLAIVYGIVRQNGGFISVYSEPDHGSTFRVYLPRFVADEAGLASAAPEPAQSKGHETVLLVEDAESILRLARSVLSRQGYTVLATADPHEALRLAAAHRTEISLLVTDVIMPAMNGRELASRVQALNPAIRCLFMSGYTRDVVSAGGAKGCAFIQKPFTLRDFSAAVRAALDLPVGPATRRDA